MDLINKKVAIEEFEDMVTSVSVYGESAEARYATNARIRFIEKLNSIPTVPAVPLEPLCQWLAGYAAPPNYALDEVRDDSIDPQSLVYTAKDRAKAWEFHFLELLKSGLMYTEESNAENK